MNCISFKQGNCFTRSRIWSCHTTSELAVIAQIRVSAGFSIMQAVHPAVVTPDFCYMLYSWTVVTCPCPCDLLFSTEAAALGWHASCKSESAPALVFFLLPFASISNIMSQCALAEKVATALGAKRACVFFFF
jgi:hypothetical protein